jgi:rubredoxin
MTRDRLRIYCPTCAHPQEFTRFRPAHGWHLVFTILTLGLWGISWLALSLHATARPWRCPRCHWVFPGTTAAAVRTKAARPADAADTA